MSANNAQALRDRLLKRAQALKQSNTLPSPAQSTITQSPKSATSQQSNTQFNTQPYNNNIPVTNIPYTPARTNSQSSVTSQLQPVQSPQQSIQSQSSSIQQPSTTVLQHMSQSYNNTNTSNVSNITQQSTREQEIRYTEAQQQSRHIKQIIQKTVRSIDKSNELIENESDMLLRDIQRLNDRIHNINSTLQQTVDSVR